MAIKLKKKKIVNKIVLVNEKMSPRWWCQQVWQTTHVKNEGMVMVGYTSQVIKNYNNYWDLRWAKNKNNKKPGKYKM